MKLKETEYSRIERNRLNVRTGIILEVNNTYGSIVFRSERPDGTTQDFRANLGYVGNLQVGSFVDFRYYNRSKNSTVLEVLGITPEEYIPEGAKIRP